MKSPYLHLIVALIVCVTMLTVYGVWYAVISAKSATAVDLQNSIDTKTETLSRLVAARTTLGVVASEETVVRNYFVSEADVVAFINALEARGRAQGTAVDVLAVSAGGTSAKPTLILSLVVEGTFDAVMRTVGAIEYAPYHLSISELSINKETRTDKDIWQASLKVIVGSVPAKRVATTTTSSI